ncbi:MAG: 50S ribosomal protein L29 [Cytophagales bacterium]|nr:50S ribosomal protein L29 [Cytophagales bacterium]
MKNSEIRLLTLEELKEKIITEQDTLQRLKFSHAITPIENPMRIKVTKRLIAQLKTELNTKQLKWKKTNQQEILERKE